MNRYGGRINDKCLIERDLNLILTVMTSHFSSATSTSTVVSNVATSPEYTSYPKQDDDALWNLYTDAIPLPPNHIIPEAEKQKRLQVILSMPMPWEGWAGAIKYL